MNDLKFAIRQLDKKSNPPEPRSFGRFEPGRESVSPAVLGLTVPTAMNPHVARHSEPRRAESQINGWRTSAKTL
jgi:hypothetical protein